MFDICVIDEEAGRIGSEVELISHRVFLKHAFALGWLVFSVTALHVCSCEFSIKFFVSCGHSVGDLRPAEMQSKC